MHRETVLAGIANPLNRVACEQQYLKLQVNLGAHCQTHNFVKSLNFPTVEVFYLKSHEHSITFSSVRYMYHIGPNTYISLWTKYGLKYTNTRNRTPQSDQNNTCKETSLFPFSLSHPSSA
jgi:hypothetical protein